MSRLLVATDVSFRRRGDQVFDRWCFDRAFFDDYAAVFDEVRVAARMATADTVDGLQRADGDRVIFVDLDDVHGWRWVLTPGSRSCRALADAVAWADAVCVRIPGSAGWHAARLAHRHAKPLMFELIGDPFAAGAGSWAQRLGGIVQTRRTRWITRHSQVGSYVSRHHLQRRYPAAPGAPTASISSIRLPASAFRPARPAPARPGALRLVFVGSLLPVKNHGTLLRAIALAKGAGLDVHLTLVGDGSERAAIEAQIQALGIERAVRLTGHIDGRARVEAELDAADLFVISSWSEGMPRAAIEAMARGLPVIGSAVGGIAELLPPEQQFDPGRPMDIVRRIEQAFDPSSYREHASMCAAIARDFKLDKLSAARRRLLATLEEVSSRVPAKMPRPVRERAGRMPDAALPTASASSSGGAVP